MEHAPSHERIINQAGNEPVEQSHDERLINRGVEAATQEERPIDDRTARYIAGQLHGGQASALYSLASTGNIIEDTVYHELYQDLEAQTPEVASWVEALRAYCQARPDKGPVSGWAEHATLLDRIEATRERTRMLGGIAVAPELPGDEEGQTKDHVLHPDRLEELFGEPPDEEIGRVDELGWFGLIVDHGTGGGTIISQDEQGFRYVWETTDGEALDQRWQAVLREYRRYEDTLVQLERHEQDDRRERVGYACPECEEQIIEHVVGLDESAWTHQDGGPLCPVVGGNGYEPAKPGVWRDGEIVPLADEADGDASYGDGPRIYVASLADYTNGELHGRWIAADRDVEDLEGAVARILATSPARRYGEAAEEWAIHDYEGFEEEVTSTLGEWPSLQDLSKVAKGIAEHGPAYGAWVAYVGRASDELVDRFEEFYRGEWGSITDYAQDYLEQTEVYSLLGDLPESIRHYVSIDVEQYAEDLTSTMHVADTPEGGVWVFDVE
ncbi:antirestriction protein ArdA [Frankia sp. BMG5.23]|uniref:antirestriction protein ArdA n=1 Tax=Frankia sp. BMG5.23 TaxID=683305 RepID=UPI000461C125|nr:antirestriction protein ArdA [Frankia sp. BMG5.23]KDA44545.1 antirestriction protein [Frankia sp. BMG5.23]